MTRTDAARRRALAVVSLLFLAVAGCQDAKSRVLGVLRPAGTALFPAGDPHGAHFRFELAIYHVQAPKVEPLPAIRRIAGAVPLTVREGKPDPEPASATLFVRRPAIAEYAPPDVEALRHSGRGLSDEDKTLLQGARSVTALAFSGPTGEGMATYRSALKLATDLQGLTGGFLWDEETREVFSAQAWSRRLESWEDGLPNMTDHVTIHAYRNGELIRLVTLGMVKFALPDVVVNGVASSDARAIGNLINLTCQLQLEGARLERAGELEVSIDAVRHAAFRESLAGKLQPGATRRALLSLVRGQLEEGDAQNRLIEIAFPGPAPSLQQRHNAVLSALFGSTDSIVQVKHDAELLDASRRARAAVLKLKPRYRLRPPDLETLLVKAPFDTPGGGTEWMWVEVVRWDGATIHGILQNDPFEVPDLKAGARVRVREGDIFDYILHKGDGTSEGNETEKLLAQEPSAGGQ